MDVSCHRHFLPGTSLKPVVIPSSELKFHTAIFSVLCVMFQVELSFVLNLSSVLLVQFPNFSLSFSLLFQWFEFLLVKLYISDSTFVLSLHKTLVI